MNRRRFLIASGAVCTASLAPRIAYAASVAEAVAAVEGARYITIGERHDNPDHHRLQAELVAALSPSGLAFEMIPHAMEETVNQKRAIGATRAELGEAINWAQSGWPSWDLYAPILEAAPGAYIAGGGLARAELGAIYAGGAAGVGDALAARYGLADALPDAVRSEMLNEQYSAHCEMIEREKLGAMVEVQRAWDAAYAEAWWRAGEKGGGSSILICGNGHARLDRAAPAYLLRAFPEATVASIGLLEDDEVAPEGRFTITLSAPVPEREDPCEQMRRAMEKKRSE